MDELKLLKAPLLFAGADFQETVRRLIKFRHHETGYSSLAYFNMYENLAYANYINHVDVATGFRRLARVVIDIAKMSQALRKLANSSLDSAIRNLRERYYCRKIRD